MTAVVSDPSQRAAPGSECCGPSALGQVVGGAVLASAVANAENNHNLDVDALVVAEASVGKSISMKRFATRARGRSSRIVKPFSRIRVVVREQEEA